MRIAIIADALDQQYAGIYIYTKEIIKAIATLDTSHQLIIVRAKAKNEFEGVEEIVIPERSFLGHAAYRLLILIPHALNQAKVDVVIEPRHFGPFNLNNKIKRITVIHDLTPLLFPKWHQFSSQLLQRIFLPHILKRADHIITNSTYTSQDVNKIFPFTKGKTTAILLGKDTIFRPTVSKDVLKKYKVQQPFFLFVGTFEPRKNLSTLIKAFNKFKATTNATHQLVLIGKKGWKNTSFFKDLEQSPFRKNIILTGYVERAELPVFYTMATAFVYPSHYEGFGLPILEAMTCGTIVISSNTSSLPEVGGTAANYFSPEDEQALTNFLIEFSLKKEQQSTASLQQSQKFSWLKAAQQLILTLENL